MMITVAHEFFLKQIMHSFKQRVTNFTMIKMEFGTQELVKFRPGSSES